jgi:very-short-patch-repair endonuclease
MPLRSKCKPEKKVFARQLRKNMTPPEKLFWLVLRCKKTGFKFRRQEIILGWIVDFYCPQKKLIIEVDGKCHDTQKQQDDRRDRVLLEYGIKTLRIPAKMLFTNIFGCLPIIKRALQ